MAIACLGLVLGLVFMFTYAVVLADGMPNMDVHAAGWAWLVVLTSGYGLYLMFKVTTADPGFADAKDAAARTAVNAVAAVAPAAAAAMLPALMQMPMPPGMSVEAAAQAQAQAAAAMAAAMMGMGAMPVPLGMAMPRPPV